MGLTTVSAPLGTYTLVSGSFNGSGGTFFSGIVGRNYDTTTTTTSNYYSASSSAIAVFTYNMGITVPSGATITECYVKVNGHAESTSNSNEYMCAQIYTGSTAISNELNFKSIGTSNSTQTIQATTLPTPEQCANLKLQCRLGYYGGAINGATIYITYTTENIYIKENGTWVQYSTVYKKSNGLWVEQDSSTWTTVLSSSNHYRVVPL